LGKGDFTLPEKFSQGGGLRGKKAFGGLFLKEGFGIFKAGVGMHLGSTRGFKGRERIWTKGLKFVGVQSFPPSKRPGAF